MKLLNTRLKADHPDMGDRAETPSVSEPQGHIHPNFRHWNWFKPTNQRAQ